VIPGANLVPFEVPGTVSNGLLVEAGPEVRQYAPNLKVDLSAQTLDRQVPSRSAAVTWSQVSGTAALIRTPAAATTQVDLPGWGPTCSVQPRRIRLAPPPDQITVVILPKLAPDAGQALTEYWFGIDGKTVASLTGSLDYPGRRTRGAL